MGVRRCLLVCCALLLLPAALGPPARASATLPPSWGSPLARPWRAEEPLLAEVAGTDGLGLWVRRAPAPDAERRGALPEGAQVEILEGPVDAAGHGWYRIRYGPDGATGWVAGEYLRLAPRTPPMALRTPAGSEPAAATADGAAQRSALPSGPGYLLVPPWTATSTLQPLPPADATDPRFGLVEAFRLTARGLTELLGARYQRITLWWQSLQAGPEAPLNPHYLPLELLDAELEQGVQLIGLLLGTPDWAAANAADGPRAVPRNLYLPWDHPQNYWARFVEQMARTYAGRIDDWIIWNEPDIRPGDPNAGYYTWAGSVQDYYQLLRVAYRAIKAGNPTARVHLAGLTYWVDQRAGRPQYFARLLELIAADATASAHNYYFDVATLHLYTDPHALYSVPRLYRDLMRAQGFEKPIWINETNVIPWDDPTNWGTGYDVPSGMRCTLADQASYLLQAFSLGLAGGAERIAVYKAEDSPGAAFNGGIDAVERAALVREDGSLRPAFLAYQTAVRYLQAARAAHYFPGTTVETVVVERPDGQRTTVLWNIAPYPVVARLAAAGTRAVLVNAVGQVYPLPAPATGEYALALPPATCNTDPDDPGHYLVGGDTYLVVEEGVAHGRTPRAATEAP